MISLKRSLIFIFLIAFCMLEKADGQVKTSFKFSFLAGKPMKGYTYVLPSDLYTKETGYGFESHHEKAPYYFSAAVPEGNYEVTITLGSQTDSSLTTVKAESRRLMLENVKTKPGQLLRKTFTVNIKDRHIKNGDTVALKPGELTKLDWDGKLTLELAINPALVALEIKKVENQTTIFLAGNSTVVNQEDEPWASWGQMIPAFFKPGVVFANHAESGLTLATFIGSKRLDKVLSVMKRGDYLFIEFGHNDQKEKGLDDGAYKSYTERLRFFVNKVRQKGGIPVILTSTSRRRFDKEGRVVNSLGDFPDAARKLAAQEKVALIDLNAYTTTLFNAMGEAGSKNAFVHYPPNTYPGQDKQLADNTHFNTYGAYEIAKCVIVGIKLNDLGIAKYLIDRHAVFDPVHPDLFEKWFWPQSSSSSVAKPDGN